jgi:hypothetical protein
VLHTWSRNLSYHPHVHCVVTGGALSLDGEHWLSARADYLFPVQVMAQLFRGKLLAALRGARRGSDHERVIFDHLEVLAEFPDMVAGLTTSTIGPLGRGKREGISKRSETGRLP